ncbi:MAG: hypothetical protein PHS92_02030 [Candidatus Gracilibacteria bacterium]|nr:hypothetical protein [Candidatus Gracilibacteria bacterium]
MGQQQKTGETRKNQEAENYVENEVQLNLEQRKAKDIFMKLKFMYQDDPAKIKKIIKEYRDVQNAYNKALGIFSEKGRSVTRNELESLKMEINDLVIIHKDTIKGNLHLKDKRSLDKGIKDGEDDVFIHKFHLGRTNGKDIAKYFEFLVANPKEMAEFRKKLDSDPELMMNFIIYWTGERAFKTSIKKFWNIWRDNHAKLQLKNTNNIKVMSVFDTICKEKQAEYIKVNGSDLSYDTNIITKGKLKKLNFHASLDEKLALSQEQIKQKGFYVGYEGEKVAKPYRINTNVHSTFDAFANKQIKFSNLNNNKIGKLLSYIAICSKSKDPEFNKKVEWFGKEPTLNEKNSVIQKFKNAMASDNEGIIKMADNWKKVKGDDKEAGETLSISRSLALSGNDVSFVVNAGLDIMKTSMNDKVGNFLSDPKYLGNDKVRIEKTKVEILAFLKRLEGKGSFNTKIFKGIAGIIEDNGVKMKLRGDKDYEKFCLDIMNLKKSENTFTNLIAETNENNHLVKKGMEECQILKNCAVEEANEKNQSKLSKYINRIKEDIDALKNPADKKRLKDYFNNTMQITGAISLTETVTSNDNNTRGLGSLSIHKEASDIDITKNLMSSRIKISTKKKLVHDGDKYKIDLNSAGVKSMKELLDDKNKGKLNKLFANLKKLSSKNKLSESQKELYEKLKVFDRSNKDQSVKIIMVNNNITEKEAKELVKRLGEEKTEKLVSGIVDTTPLIGTPKGDNDRKPLPNKASGETAMIPEYSKHDNTVITDGAITTKKMEKYLSNSNKIILNGVEVKKGSSKGEFVVAGEKCRKGKEVSNVINSVRFFKEMGLGMLTGNMSKLTETFRQSKLGANSTIKLNCKDGLSEKEQEILVGGIFDIILPDTKNKSLLLKDKIKKIDEMPKSGDRSIDFILRKKGVMIIGTQTVDYEIMKKMLI